MVPRLFIGKRRGVGGHKRIKRRRRGKGEEVEKKYVTSRSMFLVSSDSVLVICFSNVKIIITL